MDAFTWFRSVSFGDFPPACHATLGTRSCYQGSRRRAATAEGMGRLQRHAPPDLPDRGERKRIPVDGERHPRRDRHAYYRNAGLQPRPHHAPLGSPSEPPFLVLQAGQKHSLPPGP